MVSRTAHFVTFGGGSARWRLAADRLARQATRSGWFSTSLAVTDTTLADVAPSIISDHGAFMSNHPRGFGYWVWRAPLLRHLIERLPSTDVLVFLDAGCEINMTPLAQARFNEYVDDVQRHAFLAMRTPFLLYQWAKADLVHATGSEARQGLTHLIEPGVMLLSCRDENADRMREWESWCARDDYRLLDDSPSQRRNPDGFIEHRHDQAVLTCLDEKLGLHTVARETYFPGHWRTAGATFPFWATRNRWPIRRETGNAVERALSRAHVWATGKERDHEMGLMK